MFLAVAVLQVVAVGTVLQVRRGHATPRPG
jgi:hypothetical protein